MESWEEMSMKKLRLVVLSLVCTAIMVVGTLTFPSASASEGIGTSQTNESQIEPVISDDQGILADESAGEFVSDIGTLSDGASIENELNYSAPVNLSESDDSPSPLYEYLVGDEPIEIISMEDLLIANNTAAQGASTLEGYTTDLFQSDEAQSSTSALRDVQLLTEEPSGEIEWHGSTTHQDIACEILTTRSANDFVDSRWWEELIDHVDDPDGSAWVNEEHFLYNPLGGAGADDKTEDCANDALAHFRNGELESGYMDLAYSSHYLMDLGSPWHRYFPSPLDLLLHDEFEDWVRDNWISMQLYLSCRNQFPSSYMAFTGATLEQFAAELNDLVYPQLNIQYHYINLHHSHDYYEFVNSVKYCLSLTAQYTSALYAYVTPHAMLLDYVADQYPYAEVHGVGHTEKVATFVSNKIHIHLDLWNTATYGDRYTDYLYVYVYWHDGWSRTTFTDLPMTNGGYLQYDCVISNDQYSTRKVQSIEIVWHQWTQGNWLLWDGEGWTTATIVSDGFGVTQTSSTYAEAIGKTFGYDSDPEHSLGVYPVTKVKIHLEVTIPETYGDRATDWLHIDYYYTNGAYMRTTFRELPMANGGTVIFNCEILVYSSTNYAIDYFQIEWHQWTWGASHGNSWVMEGKTTIYWDTGPPTSYPI
jgi:hypothetical protein